MDPLTNHRMAVLIEAVQQKHQAISADVDSPNSFEEPQKPRTQPCKKGYKLDKTGKKCVKV